VAFITLRRESVANQAPATGFTVSYVQWDTTNRKRSQETLQSATDPGNFELAIGDLVSSFCLNSTQRQVLYNGDGTVSTKDVLNAPACASSLGNLSIVNPGCSAAYVQDGTLAVSWSGAAGPVIVRCALVVPGGENTTPYYSEQTVAGNAFTFPVPAGGPFRVGGRVGRLTDYNPNVGLGPGRYRVEVSEVSTGAMIGADVNVAPYRSTGNGDILLLNAASVGGTNELTFASGALTVVVKRAIGQILVGVRIVPPTGSTLLSLRVTAINATRARLNAAFYGSSGLSSGTVTLDNASIPASAPGVGDLLPSFYYALPAGTLIGAPTNAGAIFSNGQGGVQIGARTQDFVPRLEVDNIILFHPAGPTKTGGVVVEVHTSEEHEADPFVAYRLYDAGGQLLQTNLTGRFDGLLAGSYTVGVTTGGRTVDVPVVLRSEYSPKWQLRFDDLKNNAPCRLELCVKGYTGAPVPVEEDSICGQGDGPGPVSLSTEGLSGGDTQGDLPDSIGSSLTMRLRTAPGLLQDVLLADRNCRADFYYNEVLQSSCFVEQGIYDEALLAGPVDVELVAACGLAGLKDVDFAGHVGQELRGRRSVVNTLLHCLSRTGLSLPLAIYTNRVAAEMTTDEAPELAAFTDRLAYGKDGSPLDMRSVVDACCQLLGGTLVQRGGAWEIRSALEAATATTGRLYGPAGSGGSLAPLPSPAGRIVPPDQAAIDAGAPTLARQAWYWLGASQRRQRRAGWKFYTGTADAVFAANALRQGDYFSDAAFWDESATVLRPETGWLIGGGPFPLALVEAGGESSEFAASWPRATQGSPYGYLESELAPLVADPEGLAYEISIEAKLWLRSDEGEKDGTTASVWVEILSDDIYGPVSTGAVLTFKAVGSLRDGFTTAKALIPVGLLPGQRHARVRVHSYVYAYNVAGNSRPRVEGDTALLVKSVGIQVLPQGAKWDGKTSFVASGPGGSVRPGTPLEVFHIDAPDRAGLFNGTALAFRNTVTHGPLGPTTQWRRRDDLRPAPLLANAVLDVLALRANPSQLLTGTVRHLGYPPEALDAIDAPYDVNGRRFCVGSRTWDVRPATTSVVAFEIGAGQFITPPTPFLPQGVQVLRGLAGNARRVLLSRRPGTARAVRL